MDAHRSPTVQLCFWTLVLGAATICWLLVDINSMSIDYQRNSHLVDPKTGKKLKPVDTYDLVKIINITDDYVKHTNAQERLYDLVYNLNIENPFQIDQSYSSEQQLKLSGWPAANQTKCGHQLDWILEKLGKHRNDYTFIRGRLGAELTQLVDSFGKPEAGLYSGMLTWLGSYKSCMATKLNQGHIRTRYCFARMRPKWWNHNETQLPTKSTIRIGSCLPESCDTSSFQLHGDKIEALVKFDLPDFYKHGLEFESMFCLPDDRSPIRQIPPSGRIFLNIVYGWLALICLASAIYELKSWRNKKIHAFEHNNDDCPKQANNNDNGNQRALVEFSSSSSSSSSSSGQKSQLASFQMLDQGAGKTFRDDLLEALSIRCALKTFKTNTFRVKYSLGERARVDLSAIDFFKILMAIVIILGHSAYLNSIFARSHSNRIDINLSAPGRMSLSVTRCVDTFFFFFGVLAAYTMIKKLTTSQLSNPLIWLGINFGVLLRLSPIYMLVFWYSKTISPYIGSGPWWDYGVHKYSARGACMAEPWWRSIPLIGATQGSAAPACNLPGWFIISYAQIYILLPVIIYIICRLPNYKLRYLLVSFLAMISVCQVTIKLQTQTSVDIEKFSLYGGLMVSLMEKFESTGFMSTLGRLGSVSVGCFVGYLLHRYEIGEIIDWPRWLKNKLLLLLVITAHFVIVFLPLIGHKIMKQFNHIPSRTEFFVTNSLIMIIWPVINAIVMINAASVYNHMALVRFCGHSFWRVFNRLGLAIYLIHWEVLYFGMTNFEQAPTHGFVTDIMKTWAYGAFYSVILAFFIHILFEYPVAALLNILVRKHTKK